jgi:hypothetical protein
MEFKIKIDEDAIGASITQSIKNVINGAPYVFTYPVAQAAREAIIEKIGNSPKLHSEIFAIIEAQKDYIIAHEVEIQLGKIVEKIVAAELKRTKAADKMRPSIASKVEEALLKKQAENDGFKF